MGHSDRICIGDGNFPGASMAKAEGAIFLRADGHGIPELLDAILQVMPLDTYTETPAMLMQKMERDKDLDIPVWKTYKEVIAKHDDRGADAVGEYERFEFYEQAKKCYCILQSGESQIYANMIFMGILIAAIQTALPVFAALTLGMFCRSHSFLSREAIDGMKKVVLNVCLPFVLLEAFATATYDLSALLPPLSMFVVCCLALALGFLAVRLLKVKGRLTPFLFSGFEAGMLGYALFALLFPQRKMSDFALPDIGQTLFVFTLYKILLSGKKDLKSIGRDMLTTPILWAVAAGVLLGATGLYGKLHAWGVAGIFDGTVSFLAAPTGMIILLTVGYDLVLDRIPWKKTAALIAMRLVIMAVCLAVWLLLSKTLMNGVLFWGAALLMLLLPPPYVIPVFADEPEERVQIASALSAMTFVTMVLFAILSAVIAAC